MTNYSINSVNFSHISPKPLKKGDTIGICAPSGAFDNSRFNIGINILKSMGFNIFIPPDIYKQKRYLAGEDTLRADILNSLFDNSDIKGIICARGGFGAMRMLDFIDYELISKNPKLFAGFSDITALLVTISERSMIQVIHGPVVTSLADSDEITLQSFYQHLTCPPLINSSLTYKLEPLGANLLRTLRKGSAFGKLTGGNLATLCHLIGTKFQPNFDDSILFLEDIGEPPYKIDRMLTQMKLAGVLGGVQGLITGSFKDCGEQNIIDEIVLEIFNSPKIPIVAGFNSGHEKTNISLRFATMVEITSDEN